VNPGLGLFLRELRRQRGLTITDAAAAANLGRRTLSRWEEGHALPRLAELDSLLRALNASSDAQRQAIAMLPASRALRRVRESGAESVDASPMPHGGDLLRSLRHRRSWTQAQVAECVEVAQSTVLRWERSEAWPSPAILRRLCAALGAAEEEFAALASGRFSLAGWDGRRHLDLDELREDLNALAACPVDLRSSPLADLRYLTLEARLGSLLERRPEAASVLADAYLAHARNLFVQCRIREMRQCAQRASSLAAREDLERRMRAGIYLAEAAAFGRTTFGYEQAVRMLQPWMSVSATANTQAWICGVLGWMLVSLGDRESAGLLARRGIKVLPFVEEAGIRLHRRLPLGGILADSGSPEEALSLLETCESDSPADRAYGCFYTARASLALGRRSEAAGALAAAQERIETHKLTFMRGSVEALCGEM
jgi:transcriptional regulator with XRE-family HTH domain